MRGFLNDNDVDAKIQGIDFNDFLRHPGLKAFT